MIRSPPPCSFFFDEHGAPKMVSMDSELVRPLELFCAGPAVVVKVVVLQPVHESKYDGARRSSKNSIILLVTVLKRSLSTCPRKSPVVRVHTMTLFTVKIQQVCRKPPAWRERGS